MAIGVHTTQFGIRDPRVGLFEPVLKLAAEEMDRADVDRPQPIVRIGGVCGETGRALQEARLLADLKYNAALLSLAAVNHLDEQALLAHCREVANVLPIIGFYLQSAVGGRVLSYKFWRQFAEIENVVAIKIAPFNRYQTLDVLRAVAESGHDIALYTGNDDNILIDLVTPFVFKVDGHFRNRRIVGGLLDGIRPLTTGTASLKPARTGALSLKNTKVHAHIFRKNCKLQGAYPSLRDCR